MASGAKQVQTSDASKTLTIVRGKTGEVQRRIAEGRKRRDQFSRQQLAEFDPHKRSFDPIELLLNTTQGRVRKLLPIKYSRMSQSPFAFFRGAAPLMAADLGSAPHTQIFVQLCGDAHVQNMGCFAGPDGRLVFDINDFDETIPAPWEWEVKRMAASIMLAGYECSHGRNTSGKAVSAFVTSYIKSIEAFAGEPILAAARHQIHRLKTVEAISAALAQAERATPADLLQKYTEEHNGKRVFKELKNVLWRVMGKERQEILTSLQLYVHSLASDRLHLFHFFQPVDVAFKVVGTGSVALRDYVILMEGNGPGDPLFLQIKQEVASAYAPYLQPQAFPNQGHRVVEGQRRIQALSDLLLGWTRIGEHDYLVRQLNDHKGSIDITKLRGEGLLHLAVVAGELLARGHARSADALVIKGYLGSGDKVEKSIVKYAMAYVELTQADFELFKKGIQQGRVPVSA